MEEVLASISILIWNANSYADHLPCAVCPYRWASHHNRNTSVVRVFEGAGCKKGVPTETLHGSFHHVRESNTFWGTVTCLESLVCLGYTMFFVMSGGIWGASLHGDSHMWCPTSVGKSLQLFVAWTVMLRLDWIGWRISPRVHTLLLLWMWYSKGRGQ